MTAVAGDEGDSTGPGEGVADPGQSQTELLKKKDWGYTASVEGNTRGFEGVDSLTSKAKARSLSPSCPSNPCLFSVGE